MISEKQADNCERLMEHNFQRLRWGTRKILQLLKCLVSMRTEFSPQNPLNKPRTGWRSFVLKKINQTQMLRFLSRKGDEGRVWFFNVCVKIL